MIDGGSIDPAIWGLNASDSSVFGYGNKQSVFEYWNWQMENSLDDINLHTSNYQYYMGQGSVHTILTDAFATTLIPHPFYDEHSAEGVRFSNWIDRFVNSEKFNKESLKSIL